MDGLRIGIDGYNLAMPNGTGVATYGRVLATLLHEAGHSAEGVFGIDAGPDPALRELIFFDRLYRPPAPRRTARERRRAFWRATPPALTLGAVEIPLTDRVDKALLGGRFPHFDRLASYAGLFDIARNHFRYYRRFVRLRMKDPPGIMHWTYPVPIALDGARNIYTLHDLVPLRLPYATLDAKRYYHALVERCVRAGHVCTVSEASRGDIIEQLGADPGRVTNTYQASPLPSDAAGADPAGDAAAVGSMFGLPAQGYFLYFGAIEPKKNVARLIEAYSSLGTATPLVIVAGKSWQAGPELDLLARAEAPTDGSASGRVIRLDPLERRLLLRLVRSARAVVFPSVYEGFGLPVLEAMQVGTPVLTTHAGALAEVAADAALIVDPYSVSSIAEGLRALDEDPMLRERLTQRGLAQALRFSPDHYLSRVEAMYRHVLAGGA